MMRILLFYESANKQCPKPSSTNESLNKDLKPKEVTMQLRYTVVVHHDVTNGSMGQPI